MSGVHLWNCLRRNGLFLRLLLTDSPFRRSAGLCLGSCRDAMIWEIARDYEISSGRPRLKVFVATDVRGVMVV